MSKSKAIGGVICPRCQRTVARIIGWSKAAFPWKLGPGMELQQRANEAPRVKCTCGTIVILLRAEA